MKKNFLAITALAAVLFAGCTSSDELTTLESIKTADNTPTPVQFGTYMGKTRAGVLGGITTTEILKGTATTIGVGASTADVGFGVFGYQIDNNTWATSGASTAPNFMYNQQVKWNTTNNAWEYTPIKYWPNGTDAANAANSPSNTATSDNDDKLNFFAYAPYVELTDADLSGVGITKINNRATKGGASSEGNQKQGDPTVIFTLDATNLHTAANVDLLWGTRSSTSDYEETDGTSNDADAGGAYKDASNNYYNTDLTKQTVGETIDFLFKHALAKIGGKSGLKIVADIDGNGAGIGGYGTLDSKTCITVRSINIKNKGSETFNVSGTFNLATGAWSDYGTATPAAEALINENISTAGGGTIAMNSEIYNATGAPTYSSSTWSPLGVTTTAKDVYATGGQDAFYLIPGSTVTLTVAVNYDITTYDENINGNYVKINQTITNDVTVSIPANGTNKFYTLVLHLGLTSVKFSAEVADWEDAGAGVVEEVWLPSNVVSNSTSVTLASGSGTTVNTDATAHTYTINLTGLTNNGAITVNSNDTSNASVSTAPSNATSTEAAIPVVLTANTSGSPRNFTITITDTTAGTTTTVTVTQAG